MLEEESTRLTAAMNNRKFNGTDIAEVLVTATTPKLVLLKNEFIKKLEKLESITNIPETKLMIEINRI
jgi:hypothetical protein